MVVRETRGDAASPWWRVCAVLGVFPRIRGSDLLTFGTLVPLIGRLRAQPAGDAGPARGPARCQLQPAVHGPGQHHGCTPCVHTAASWPPPLPPSLLWLLFFMPADLMPAELPVDRRFAVLRCSRFRAAPAPVFMFPHHCVRFFMICARTDAVHAPAAAVRAVPAARVHGRPAPQGDLLGPARRVGIAIVPR